MKTEGVYLWGGRGPLRVIEKRWERCLSGTDMNIAQLSTYILVKTIIKLFFYNKNKPNLSPVDKDI